MWATQIYEENTSILSFTMFPSDKAMKFQELRKSNKMPFCMKGKLNNGDILHDLQDKIK